MNYRHQKLYSLGMTVLCVFVLSSLAACGPDETALIADPPVVANLEGLSSGWNEIAPGGETICSDGSPYRFFVRPADPEKLIVYFQGGGACWFGQICDPDLEPSYKINTSEDDPGRYNGIFDFDNPANPFANHSVVFAPYCTADVHIGDKVATYESPEMDDHAAHPVTIHHKGFANSAAVLAWTYEHFFTPSSIFVTGSSAGAIPSPYYAMVIADHYSGVSNALIAQLGDGAGGYRRGETETYPHESWGTLAGLRHLPEFAAMAPEDFNYERLYIAAATRYPHITFAEYDAAEDSVQRSFLEIAGGEVTSLVELLDANQADIRAAADNFRSYVAGGDLHTVLGRPEFYTYRVGDVSVRDWVANLAAGGTVNDVHCVDCGTAEVFTETE